jgi:hypothetical protein
MHLQKDAPYFHYLWDFAPKFCFRNTPWEKRQVGNFVKNTLDIFHFQTSEAKSSPNLVSQGVGLERN